MSTPRSGRLAFFPENPSEEDLQHYRENSKFRPFLREDPFFLRPEFKYHIALSGGQTSAYLLHRILERNDNRLPENAVAIFTNTGKEREETLEFLRKIELNWGVEIVWLEFHRDDSRRGVKGDPKNTYRIMDFESASREGEPFSVACGVQQTIPGTNQRFCTSRLKIIPADQYVAKGLGWKRKETKKLLGIRADEPNRASVAWLSECPVELPLMSAAVTRQQIQEFWAQNDFRLEIPGYMGNCDCCFMKSQNIMKKIIQAEPERLDWWIWIEENYGRKNHRFRRDMKMRDLRTTTLDSDKVELSLDEEALTCFCGDD